MIPKSGEATGDLVQRYIRPKRNEGSDREVANAAGQQLQLALKLRIDVLGADADELLKVTADSVIQKLQELEKQAALEDLGMVKQADRSSRMFDPGAFAPSWLDAGSSARGARVGSSSAPDSLDSQG